MSEIKAGDLVVVVKPQPCCGGTSHLGSIHVVHGVGRRVFTCSACWKPGEGEIVIYADGTGSLLSVVRKIEPLEDPVAVDTEREVTA